MEFWFEVLQAGVRLAAPILIAAQGEAVLQRSGVINIGVEGQMLGGAFAGMLAAYGVTQAFAGPAGAAVAPYAGALAGALAGAAISLVFAFFAIVRRGDQIVVGTAVNILGLGLTGLFNRRLFGVTGEDLSVPTFQRIHVPWAADWPGIGWLFRQNPLTYLALALTAGAWLFLYRTRHGLAVRALGERPQAADSVGIPVIATRVRLALFGGLASGVAGSALSLLHSNTFVEGMTVGKGFIAIAIVIFGRWNPLGIALAALFFGVMEALGIRLQTRSAAVPYQVFQMAPYVLTLLALAGLAGRARGPAALGLPYWRE